MRVVVEKKSLTKITADTNDIRSRLEFGNVPSGTLPIISSMFVHADRLNILFWANLKRNFEAYGAMPSTSAYCMDTAERFLNSSVFLASWKRDFSEFKIMCTQVH